MFHYIWKAPQYAKLSHTARTLLVHLALQYNGFNNDDLNERASHAIPDRGNVWEQNCNAALRDTQSVE